MTTAEDQIEHPKQGLSDILDTRKVHSNGKKRKKPNLEIRQPATDKAFDVTKPRNFFQDAVSSSLE